MGIRRWYIVGEDDWYMVGANPWYIVGEDRWYMVAANSWYMTAEEYWYIVARGLTEIEKYMSIHQHDPNANELWMYFRNVIEWVGLTFTTYRREMKGIDWGSLYDEFKDKMFDTEKLELEIQTLMMDDDVTNKKGVYPYVLTRKEKYLNIRDFSERQRRAAYERQKGICPGPECGGKHFEFNEMEADHITPWHLGGKTVAENCRMLCKDDNRRKSGK